MVNKCCISNVKNAVSKQKCNINLNYIKSMRYRFRAICEKCYTYYWQIIEYKRNKLMNCVLKELYHKTGMKISDFLFIDISDT